MRRLLVLPLLVLVLVAGCSDDDDASDQVVGSPSGSVDEEPTTTSSTTTTTAPEATTTTTFAGATTPTSIESTATAVALLTDVTVEASRVTFTFRNTVPGVDAGYVEEVTADGSGEPVAVGGGAHLQIRMEPASGVDLSSESFEETYTGPDRISGPGPVVEVVRTGDFEANLTWVIGVTDERAYNVVVDSLAKTVTVNVAP